MASKSKIAKARRTPKFTTRREHRCQICGRPRAVYRKFGICRILLPQPGGRRTDSRREKGEFGKGPSRARRATAARARSCGSCPRRRNVSTVGSKRS